MAHTDDRTYTGINVCAEAMTLRDDLIATDPVELICVAQVVVCALIMAGLLIYGR